MVPYLWLPGSYIILLLYCVYLTLYGNDQSYITMPIIIIPLFEFIMKPTILMSIKIVGGLSVLALLFVLLSYKKDNIIYQYTMGINPVADNCSHMIAGEGDLLQPTMSGAYEETLFVSEKITLKRASSFQGVWAKFKYIVNETEVYSLANNFELVIEITRPVNTIRLKDLQGIFNDSSLIKFTVSAGKRVVVGL